MSAECTIQDVFNHFYPDYVKTHELSAAQRKVAYHIRNCKTGVFGVNVSVCEECGCISIHYNSCRDRCCPMCQEFPKEKMGGRPSGRCTGCTILPCGLHRPGGTESCHLQ